MNSFRVERAVAVVALLTFTWWHGHGAGRDACEAVHNAERLDQIEVGRMLETARRKAAQERDQLARELKEKANAEPVSVERCLSPGQVRRLNAIH